MPAGRLVRTAPSNKTRSVNPDRISKFLDSSNQWGTGSCADRGASASPMVTAENAVRVEESTHSLRPQTVYDPSLSWDGLSVNPKAFSRLNVDPRVNGKVLLAGSQAMYTTTQLPGGVFENVSRAGEGIAAVPNTAEQIDCQMNAGPAAPAASVARSGGTLTMTYQPPKFSNMLVQPAQVGVAPTHPSVTSSIVPVAGGMGTLKRYVMSPQERRAIQTSEYQQMAAANMSKKAELQRRRLGQLLQNRHPQGACRVDGVNNPNSEVYGAKAQRQLSLDQRAAIHAEGRKQRLHLITGLEPRYGFNPFHANEEWLDRNETKFMQQKRCQPGPRPDTQGRLFGSTEVRENPLRSQNLRDRDLPGRDYNFVTNAAIVSWPSKRPDASTKHDYAYMTHPSQQSLERQRSVQGQVQPGDRSSGIVIS